MRMAAAARDSSELSRCGLSSDGLANATLLCGAAAAAGGVEWVLGIRPAWARDQPTHNTVNEDTLQFTEAALTLPARDAGN